MSDPQPTVALDPVQQQHIVVLPGGTQAQVRVSGIVTDPLADIVAEHAADIREVTTRGISYPVTLVGEPATPARPYPFKGRFNFTVTIPIRSGRNTVVVQAVNAVGAKGHDSVSLVVLQSQSTNDSTPTVSTFAPKFLDPFSVQAAPPDADGRQALLLYRASASGEVGRGSFRMPRTRWCTREYRHVRHGASRAGRATRRRGSRPYAKS